MNDALMQIQGSYKLSASVVKRLAAKGLSSKTSNRKSGATKYMIATMIHFSHICSSSGDIQDFCIAELQLVLHCSKRTTFNVLNDLIDKGFIEVSGTQWNGYRHIHIIDNDFPSDTNYNEKRYLNTNRSYFDYRNNQGYDKFLGLSLFAMKMFLLLLLNYNNKNGYHVSFDTLCQQLQVKNRALIHSYVKEIEEILPDKTLCEKPNVRKHLKYGSLYIHNQAYGMIPEYGLNNFQDTYYTYKWQVLLKKLDVHVPLEEGTLHRQAGRIYAIVSTYLKKKLSLELIENTIKTIMADHGIINSQTYTDIYNRLSFLV